MSAFFSPLQTEALLHISGPDSLTFLQGQTTCDTRDVNASQAVPGAYCNVQGRMVCDFLLLQLAPEHFTLRLKADTLDKAAATFGKYIVFSKAELQADNRDWHVFGCWGESAPEALRSLGMALPSDSYQASTGDGYVLVQVDDTATRFEAYINTRDHRAHADALSAALTAAPESQWRALQIRAGIGRVEGPNVEELLPQMLNYDVTGHVSFTKGCYTGQEIVARLHYRGKAKRRMYLGQSAGAAEAAAGTALFNAGSEQSVGTVVNAASEGEKTVCLVSATEAGIAQGLRLGTPAGPPVDILPLPYSVNAGN